MAVAKLIAADKGHHVAVYRFYRGNGPLYCGLLLQQQSDGSALLGRRGVEGDGFTFFAALGIGFGSCGFRSGNPYQVAGADHKPGILDSRSIDAGHLGIGLARPRHVAHRDEAGIALAQTCAGFFGVY